MKDAIANGANCMSPIIINTVVLLKSRQMSRKCVCVGGSFKKEGFKPEFTFSSDTRVTLCFVEFSES